MAYLSPIQFANSNPLGTTLSATIVAGDNSLTIASQAVLGCPTTPSFDLLIDNELITVNGIAGNVCSPLSRGAGGTTPAGHAGGAPVYGPITKGMMDAAFARVDQANALGFQAPILTPSGLYAAVQTASRIVGAVAPGVGTAWTPAGGPYSVGDVVLDVSNATHIVCTVAGTPGTWVYSPSLSLAQVFTSDIDAKTFEATGAASLGSAVSGRYVGNWSTTGTPTGLTAEVGDHGFDGNGNLFYCTAAGTPGTWKSPHPWGTLGFAQVTTTQSGITTVTDLTGLTTTVTVGTGRRIRITGFIRWQQATSTSNPVIQIQEGATILADAVFVQAAAGWQGNFTAEVVLTPSAGSHTYKLTLQTNAGSVSSFAAATEPAFILVEDIGT